MTDLQCHIEKKKMGHTEARRRYVVRQKWAMLESEVLDLVANTSTDECSPCTMC